MSENLICGRWRENRLKSVDIKISPEDKDSSSQLHEIHIDKSVLALFILSNIFFIILN